MDRWDMIIIYVEDLIVDGHTVHVDAHHGCYDGWVDPEKFIFLSQRIADIW